MNFVKERFLQIGYKSTNQKEKMDEFDFPKFKSFALKRYYKKMKKGKPTERKKIFANKNYSLYLL